MNIRPLHDRVLVRKLQEAETTKSGRLHLPQTAQHGSQLGLVIAVGEGRSFDGPGEIATYGMSHGIAGDNPSEPFPLGFEKTPSSVARYHRQRPVVHIGQMVLFGKFSGTEVEIEGDTVFILREDEVVAVLEDPPQELIDRAQKREAATTN